MSFGYVRKMSPAAQNALERAEAGRRFRQLKNLRIDEISTVDRGAGRGVQILLAKKSQQEAEMTDIAKTLAKLGAGAPVAVCKAAHAAACEGAISDHKLGQLQKDMAEMMFAGDPKALSKFLKTAAGRATLAPRPKYPASVEYELRKREADELAKRAPERPTFPNNGSADLEQHLSPYYKTILSKARDLQATPEGAKMSDAQAFAHICKTPEGAELLGKDRAWRDSRIRSFAAQGAAGI
jgi:hypothetical protein